MAGELITFKIATGWIEKLAKQYAKLRGNRIKELDPIADELMVIPQELAPVYVEPDLQQYNPADESDEDEEEFRVPALGYLENFIKARKEKSDGRRQLFILADAGMGKSSLLAMFKLGHVNRFWPRGYECLPIKLGPNTLERLKPVTGRGNTILLLDALDEDKEAIGRIEDRIIELLKETQNFLRVVITCRNQFLPLGNSEVFPRQDRIKLGGFTCPVKYVSPFSDEQVKLFLEKRFPRSWRQKILMRGNQQVTYAEEVIKHMDDLRFRPMLLANVDDLIGEGVAGNPYLVYRTMVDKWLDREATKPDSQIDRKKLLIACIHLARHMTNQSIREVNKSELEKILETTPELAPVKLISFSGRSLLNRNSEGAFRFAHQSIQEFLAVHALAHGFRADWPIPQEMMIQFLRYAGHCFQLKVKAARVTINIIKTEVNLILANLGGANLRGANLSGARLRGANLSNVALIDADLSNVDLSSTNLGGANLTGANLGGANLTDANLWGANLKDAYLGGANLKDAYLRRTNLSGANLFKTNHWKRISNIKKTNIYGVIDAPGGYREWALENGAVGMPPDEWEAWKEAGFPRCPEDKGVE